jgi:DNA-binding PadR family transcriptional regulator
VQHGLLDEEQEEGGRRRRSYSITPAGREALDDWLAEPAEDRTEIRDLGLLKLFFGELSTTGDVAALAEAKERGHRAALGSYERLRDDLQGIATPAELATLELGLRYERTAADFWAEIRANPPVSRK